METTALVLKLKKNATDNLLKKLKSATDEEKDVIIQILKERGKTEDIKEETITKKVKGTVVYEAEPEEEIEVLQEDLQKETKKSSVRKTRALPKEGSKALVILEALKKGDKSKYQISKDLNTYFSVVDSVAKRYLK